VDMSAYTAGDLVDLDVFGIKLTVGNTVAADGDLSGNLTVTASTTANFVVGSSGSVADDTVSLSAIDLTTANTGLNVSGTDLTDATNAEAALLAIDSALETLSEKFGEIGAKQNRIEYATRNVKTAIENYSAAES